MNFQSLESQKSKRPDADDESVCASWGCLLGSALGLLMTVWLGHWLSNAIVGAIVGFFVGALIDRSRR